MQQAIRVANKAKADEWRDRREDAAFVGWHFRAVMGGSRDSFDAYLRKLGLREGPSISPDEKAAAIERSRAILDRARTAFRKGAARQ